MTGIQSREFVKSMSETKVERIALMSVNGKAMALFEWMKFAMDKKNGLIVSNETMAEIFGGSVRTIERHIRFLKSNKLIQSTKAGRSNVYSINAKVACWNSHPTTFIMSANVILNAGEAKGLAKRIKEVEKDLKGQINTRIYNDD